MNSIKKFFTNFKQYPELAIALGIIVIALLYLAIKNATSQAQQAQQQATQSSANPPLMVYDFSFTPPAQQPVSPPTPTSNGGGTPVTPPPPVTTPPPVTQPPIITPPPKTIFTPNPPLNRPSTARTQVVGHWPAWDSTLWGIAQHYYGNGALWPKIYAANQAKIGPNANLIHPGLVLTIP